MSNKKRCLNCDKLLRSPLLEIRCKLYSGDYLCGDCIPKAGFSNDIFTPKKDEKLTNDVVLKRIIDWENSKDERLEQKLERQAQAAESLKELNEKYALKCPYCSSKNVDFMQNKKKNFSVGKAVAGTALTGGVGSLAGFVGKKGNNQWHCKNCGQIFETKNIK